MRIGAWMAFAGLWATVVYFPVAHWVFALNRQGGAEGGWIVTKLKAIDFAGGTAVEINAGVAGLMLAVILGKRHGWPREPMRPHNLPFLMLGSGLLWFGFNSGSAYTANGAAGTTLIGGLAGGVCAFAVSLKHRLGFDDSLDVVGVHLVGGVIGTLMIGLVAAPQSPAGVAGLFYGGGPDQLGRQAVAIVAVLVYSLVCTAAIAYALKFTIGLRVDHEGELRGIDEAEHAESAYDFAPAHGGGASRRPVFGAPVAARRD